MLSMGSVLTFLSVFFLNQCFNRWSEQWQCTCAAMGQITSAACLLRGYTGAANPLAQKLVRYMNVAHLLAYVGVPQGLEYDVSWFEAICHHFKLLDQRELSIVLRLLLADPDCARNWKRGVERERSDAVKEGPGASFEVTRWCIDVLHTLRKTGTLSHMEAHSVEKAVIRQRESLANVHYYDALPIPFAYYNTVTWTLLFYRPLAAYHFAVDYSDVWYFSWTAVLFLNLVLVGVITLAEQLATPYGTDDVDISVSSFAIKGCQGSAAIMSSEWNVDPDNLLDHSSDSNSSCYNHYSNESSCTSISMPTLFPYHNVNVGLATRGDAKSRSRQTHQTHVDPY